ncbi:hypothetical protein I3842_09G189900 [Carya illinoinensis]|uniref:Secreted protein n=1 Tax=Carya illinoinensis TaxID=32201 RepID=A0A922E666_CARIL|nr:hypothetical protein I3842_09G189900 [Carya illinoinensis]
MWVLVLLLFWRKVGVSTLPPWEERVWLFSSSLGGWSGCVSPFFGRKVCFSSGFGIAPSLLTFCQGRRCRSLDNVRHKEIC